MNDRAVELLEQYEIEVLRVRKGRGAFLCDTAGGSLIFKEISGSESRLRLQDRLLKHIKEAGVICTEQIIPNAQGELFVKDVDDTRYVLKTWSEGRECNIRDSRECLSAVELLAKLHHCMGMELGEEEIPVAFSVRKEYDKHNRELRKVRKYLSQKSQKSWFEINLAKHFDFFLDQALSVTRDYQDCGTIPQILSFCHGDYQYHNILKQDEGWFLVNFEKFVADDPIRDLYLLLRKLLEKSDWSVELGYSLLEAYERVRPISATSRRDLYYRLAYPEKFWKIVNFYYNSGKAWIPGRNLEKLEKLVEQEPFKQHFLDTVFHNL